MTRHCAFISYSHADTRFAVRLQRDLETFRIPRETTEHLGRESNRLGSIFRDVSDLGAATTLSAALTDALANSDALVVICSPEATESKWVEQEILEFRRIHGGDARVLTVIAPTAGEQGPESLFPAALGASPPLAADARRGADGRRLALLKIVAGLLGTGLDRLIRRDAQRRQARLLAGTLVSTTIAIAMAVLAVFALSAREDARRRLSQSEDLIGFMLGDLRTQLTPLGQVGVLQSVGDKALSYFESLEDADLTDAALLRKSRALYQIGDVYFELGEFQSAQNSFRLSLEQARQLAAAQPDSNERLFELSQAEFWAGYAAWYADDLAVAAEHLNAYHQAAWVLHDREPDNPDWVMETFWASNNLGSLAFRRQRYDAARAHFQEAVARINVLIDEDATLNRLYERSTVLSWLGSTFYRLGDLQSSQDAFLKGLDAPLDAENALHEEERAFQMGKLAAVAMHRGDMQMARSYATQAVGIATQLADSDPESMAFLYGRTLQELGLASIDLREGAPVAYTSIAAATRRLLATEDTPPTWRGLALDVADIGIRIGDPEAPAWAMALLDAELDALTDGDGMTGKHMNLFASIARLDQAQEDHVRRILPLAAENFAETKDFDLALPLFRAYATLGDEAKREAMRAVLVGAESRHPDVLSP